MQQLVRVQKCNDDQTVLVVPVQFCFDNCQSCTGCKSPKMQLRKVRNSIDATCGQVVVLTTNSWLKLLLRACYLLPVLLMFVGLAYFGSTGGIFGFFSGLTFTLWMTTKDSKAYTITGLSERPEEKGDNDLD